MTFEKKSIAIKHMKNVQFTRKTYTNTYFLLSDTSMSDHINFLLRLLENSHYNILVIGKQRIILCGWKSSDTYENYKWIYFSNQWSHF